jgi:hypothetical protein
MLAVEELISSHVGEERRGEKRNESQREVMGLRKKNGEYNSINIVGFTR